MDAVNDGVFEWNSQTREIYFSPKNYTMLGYSPYEFEPTHFNWNNLIHPDDKQMVNLNFIEHAKGNTQLYETEFRMRTKDGNFKWILERGKLLVKGPNGEALRVIGVHSDIDLRKKVEENLIRERDFTSLIAQTSPVGIISLNVSGEIIFANAAAEKLLCLKKETENIYKIPDLNITDMDGNIIFIEKAIFEEISKSKKSVINLQYCLLWPNGYRNYVSIKCRPYIVLNR